MSLTKVTNSMVQGAPINVVDFGADATGATPSSDAFISAMSAGSNVYIPPGTYTLDKNVPVPSGVHLFGQGGVVLTKAFDGAAITIASLGSIDGISLNGNGATYAGVGVLISSGTPGQNSGKQLIQNCRIYDTESYCVEYLGDGVGYASVIQLCELSVYNNTVAAVKWPVTDTLNGNRKIIDCQCNLGPLVDVGGADNGLVHGNICGVSASLTASPCVVFPSSANRKIVFSGNRLASGGYTFNVDGYSHTFVGNVIAGPVTFASTTGTISFDLSNVCTGVVDSSVNGTNQIYIKDVAYNPTWASDTVQPDIGNGTIKGILRRNGRRVSLNISVAFGSTTTFGTGGYYFSAPFVADDDAGAVVAVGCVRAISSGVGYYLGAAYINPNSSQIHIVSDGGTSDWNPTTPVTWKSGDSIVIDIEYQLK